MKNTIDIRGEFYRKDGETLKSETQTIIVDSEYLIYEVLRIIGGKPLFLNEHVIRLFKSIKLKYSDVSFNKEELFEKLQQSINCLCDKNNILNGNVQILIEVNNNEIKNYVYFIDHYYPEDYLYDEGIKTVCVEIEREDPNAKVLNLKYKERIKKIITEKNAFEAILINKDNEITEGSKSNVFFVKGEKFITSRGEKVLEGITRMKIIEIIRREGYGFEERIIRKEEIEDMDAAFISGTSPKVLPIKTIGDFNFESASNRLISDLMRYYELECENDIEEQGELKS
ncbi:aminotransferase class IV [Oceanirhabdus seepicola]|uniref:Aminotransferase class IV n=1 Tax=Oceanirhabdus seepicola TaxID=2828781 RepID=A0A9J6NUI8_9CLOT|nr:aminotransferase class IV [Oceanirhabdus seepicola]MCM1988127.1 aminotransferase class IV [Oceanirhabdus seepicola]